MSEIPFTPEEGLVRLALTAVLMVVVLTLAYIRRLGIGKEVVVSAIRGFVQLMLFAVILTYIFDSPDWWLLVWGVFAAMIIMAGYTSAKRAPEINKAWEITTPSIVIGAAVSLIVMASTRIMPLEPQFVIPLAGMAFGNSMNVCSLTLNRLIGEFKNNRQRIEAALALGATSTYASRTYLNTSVTAALIPLVDHMKNLGIIFIPGAMTGLLMAGADPLLAAEFQIVVFFMIMCTTILTTMLVTHMAVKRLFTDAHQLVEI